jgi:hypothetical protein
MTMILTAFHSSTATHNEIFQECVDVARFRGIPLILVDVICSTADNLPRIGMPGRLGGGGSKLRSTKRLLEFLHPHSLIHPFADFNDMKGVEVHSIELWTSGENAEEAVDELVGRLMKKLVG